MTAATPGQKVRSTYDSKEEQRMSKKVRGSELQSLRWIAREL